MKYRIKCLPNEVCNLSLNQTAKDDKELADFLKIIQRTAGLLLPEESKWSKAEITKDVDVYTMPIGPGRLYIAYVIKEQ